jgi:hypothetical protein
MYEPTLKNLTNVDYGKPPDSQNQVSYKKNFYYL